METWFLLAVLSAVSGGFGSFTHKVVAERNHDTAVIAAYASIISTILVLICTYFFVGFSGFTLLMFLFAFLAAATYFASLMIKVDALRVIDTAIYFPLYKIVGPLITIIFGVTFFGEAFTTIEWIGLFLSLTVPLLLITKDENRRQRNLVRGLWLIVIGAFVGAVSVTFAKAGADVSPNVWLFIGVGEALTAFSAIATLYARHRHETFDRIQKESSPEAIKLSLIKGVLQAIGAVTMIFAFAIGGPLGIVYTINSLYILIPIILSIIIYNEHWNAQKVIAIILSIAALGLLK